MNIDFLITSLIVVASPGTGALVTVAAGLSRGVRTSIVAALGCTLGILTHMLVAITGPRPFQQGGDLAGDPCEPAQSAMYSVFAASVRERVLSRPGVLNWMRRRFVAAFVGLGVKLALVHR